MITSLLYKVLQKLWELGVSIAELYKLVLDLKKSVERLLSLPAAVKDLQDKVVQNETALISVQAELQQMSVLLQLMFDSLVPSQAVELRFTAVLEDGSILEDVRKIVMTDTQKVSMSIRPVDKKGKPALVDGIPVWASSDEAVVALTPAADGMSCVAVAGDPGASQITVTCDADLGGGVKELTGSVAIEVTAGEAQNLVINVGTPEENEPGEPPAPPPEG